MEQVAFKANFCVRKDNGSTREDITGEGKKTSNNTETQRHKVGQEGEGEEAGREVRTVRLDSHMERPHSGSGSHLRTRGPQTQLLSLLYQ